MELSRVTRFLLWALSKRPDVHNIDLKEAASTPVDTDLPVDRLTPQEITALQADFLDDIFNAPSARRTDRNYPC